MGLAVDAGEVAGHEEAAVGQREEGLDLRIEVEGLAGPVAGVHVEGGEAARGLLGAVLALLDAGEVAAHVHRGPDLREGLNLDVAFGVGAVDVTGHAPRGLGRVVGDGAAHGLLGSALVGQAGEVRGVGGDARTHVGLGVGEDSLSALVEEGGRRGDVSAPAGRSRAVTPADGPAGAARGVDLERVPPLVVAGGIPHVGVDAGTVVEGDVDRVGHLEGPHEVRHLGELQVDRLVREARGTPGAKDAHAVRLILDVFVVEQLVDGGVGVLNDVEGVGVAHARGQLRGVALAAAPAFPAFAAAADEDPTAAVCRLVTKELRGGIHRGGLQPVGAVRSRGITLLDVPAGGRGSGGAQAVMRDGLTGLTDIICVRHRGEREGRTRNNRRGCKDCKARNCGSHDTTFRLNDNLLHK